MTSTGAKTGTSRSSPLGYTRDEERYVVVGSNSGSARQPVWLANIRAEPFVTVEAGGVTFRAHATVTTGAERRRLLDAHQAAIPHALKGSAPRLRGVKLTTVGLASRSVPFMPCKFRAARTCRRQILFTR